MIGVMGLSFNVPVVDHASIASIGGGVVESVSRVDYFDQMTATEDNPAGPGGRFQLLCGPQVYEVLLLLFSGSQMVGLMMRVGYFWLIREDGTLCLRKSYERR